MSEPGIVTHPLEGTIAAYPTAALLKGVLLVGHAYRDVAEELLRGGARLVSQGELTLRLGVALFDRPFIFVPHSVIDERGASFQGEIVFDWLRLRAYEMPRSEVFGLNAQGMSDQVFAREVDVESSPIVVGGPETAPVYVAAVLGEAPLPPRFAQALRPLSVSRLSEVRPIVESM